MNVKTKTKTKTKITSLLLALCMLVSLLPTFALTAAAEEETELPTLKNGKITYDFTTVSGEWEKAVLNGAGTAVSYYDISGITYDYTDGNWEFNSMTGSSARTYSAYMQLIANSGKQVAFNIKVPEDGLYAVSLNNRAANGGGKSEIHILPGGDIETLLENGGYKVGEVDFYSETTITSVNSKVGSIWLDKGENVLVFKSVGTGRYLYPISLTLDKNNQLSKIAVSIDKENLEIGQTAKVTAVPSLLNGTELSESECTVWYTSSDERVATVDAYGNVTAVGAGFAEITANAVYEGVGLSEKAVVTVTDSSEIVNAELNVPEKIYVGIGAKMNVYLRMQSGARLDVTENAVFSSDSEAAFTVEDGIITANSEGKATVTATVMYNDIEYTASAEVSALEPELKSAPTIYTYAKREAALENIKKYDWAKEMSDEAVNAAEKYADNYELYYNAVTAEGIPRSMDPSLYGDPDRYYCRYCGENLQQQYGNYPWLTDSGRPWKIQCPECKRLFPSNDFESFYKLGLNEQGEFDRIRALEAHREMLVAQELIDASVTDPGEEHSNDWKAYYGYGVKGGYLVNEIYPEVASVDTINCGQGLRSGEAAETWGVDDGFGYAPTDENGNSYTTAVGGREVHAYIACYNFWLWRELGTAIEKLSEAYLYTGDERYGKAGAVLLDRVADVFPAFDSLLYYDSNRYNCYYLGDGGTRLGKVLGSVWDTTYLATPLAYATDALYPMLGNPEVIAFLSEKAKEFNLDNTKTSAELIWSNWADGILRTIFDGAQSARLCGNIGHHQTAVAAAAISLASEPEKGEMLDWMYRTGKRSTSASNPYNTGGDINQMLIDTCDRNGVGSENAVSYNAYWLPSMFSIAELTVNEAGQSLFEHPKFRDMFTTEIPLVLSGNHHAQIGDSQSTASIDFVGDREVTIKGFKQYGTYELAQYLYLLNGFSASGLHYDIFEKNPERIQQEILACRDEKSVIQSDMVTGFGYAVLRGGNGLDKIDERKNPSDFWMYFGKTTGHGHLDALNIGIEAYGLNLAPDLGYPESTGANPNRLQWIDATVSHNTIVVDDKSQQESGKTSKPLHFDSAEKVKLVDVDANDSYAQTENYRRTLVMVDVDDRVSYGVDFFRVTGGDKHTFSFHSQAENASAVEGLEMTAQVDENGEYIGTYAGADVAYGPDPDTNYSSYVYQTKYPRGYTWMKNVRRDTSPEKTFAVEFDVEDYRDSIKNGDDITLRMTQLNSFAADEVALVAGHVPQREDNAPMPQSLDYVLVQRKGENLDSLFTTVYEPYMKKRYIKSIEAVPVEIEDGSERANDKVQAVKVSHKDGRVDYIVYATNKEILYSVDGTFLFSGFVGVYSLDKNGICTYRYVNDGEVIGAATGKEDEYSGKVIGISRELSTTNYIDVDFDCDDLSELIGRYIHVKNDEVENGVYKIENAEKVSSGIRLYVDSTLIRSYRDAENFDAGFIYNIAVGQRATVPLSFEDTEKFEMNDGDAPVSVTLSYEALALAPREQKVLHASVKPITAKNATLTWESSDENIVTVNEKGKITAVAPGTAEIAATAAEGVSAVCTVTVADIPLSSDGIWGYEKCDDGIKLTKYFGNEINVVVPSVIVDEEGTQQSVVRLGNGIFRDNTLIETATLGEGIKEIGDSAFEGATSLVCIFTPNSLTKIGSRAFYGCGKFNSVILYSNVISIGSNAFGKCPELVIYCEDGSEAHTHAKYNYIKYEIIGVSVPEIVELNGVTYYVMGGSSYAISYDGSVKQITIPDEVNGCPVVSIGEAFRESGVESIVIPESVTLLDPYAFEGCTELVSVTLPENLKTIGKRAFTGCKLLKSVKIPDGVALLPEAVFSGCPSLAEITLPAELTAIGANAFYGCKNLSGIEFPENIEVIGNYAFYNCASLKNPQIPDSVASIGNYAFAYCSAITEIELPSKVKALVAAFANCKNLEKVILPEEMTSIGSFTFRNCTKLVDINIPDSIKTISSGAFYGCSALTEIKLPENLMTLMSDAFRDCTGLVTVIIPEGVSRIAEDSFAPSTVWLVYENSFAHIKAEEYDVLYMIYNGGDVSVETYTDENGVTYLLAEGRAVALSYNEARLDVVIPENVNGYPVTEIGQVFKESAVESIVIPSSVTEIKDNAFYSCRSLESISLPGTIKAIGEYAFYNCDSITKIELPEGVASIGRSAFYGCNKLASVALPESLTEIPAYAFAGNSILSEINIPQNVKAIGNYAFRNCSMLNGIVLPEGLESIGAYAFAANGQMTEISVPSSVSTIGANAFENCINLASLTLNEGIEEIGDNAFAGCSSLLQILVPESVSAISRASIPVSTVWIVHENSLAHQRAESYGALYMLYNAENEVYGEIIQQDGVTYIILDSEAVAVDFDNSVKSVTVPESINGYPVTDIGEAFSGKSKLSEIIIPSTISEIKNNAFKGCYNLGKVTLPESITLIGNNAFMNCTHLTEINLPDGITSIGDYAFNSCKYLSGINLPTKLISIGGYAFANCSRLKEIVIPDGVETLGTNLFSNCSELERVAIANSVTEIGSHAFAYCIKLTTVTIPESVTEIQDNAFAGCSGIKQVLIPATVDIISKSSFNSGTLWLVYYGSRAHNYAKSTNVLHFVIDQAYIPEIAYGASITGSVIDSEGNAVPGALVEILYDDGSLKEKVETDENGIYTFTYAEVGSYTIRATDALGNSGTEKISVRRMNIFDVFISGNTEVKIKTSYTVSGTVSPATATITLTDTDGNVIETQSTTSGTYSFASVPNGSYIVKAETENGSVVREITVFNANVTVGDIVVENASTAIITGTVDIEDREGGRYKKVWVSVTLYNEDGISIAQTRTNEDGTYTFENVPLGNYSLVAETEEMRPDKKHKFDRSHKLCGYAYVEIIEPGTYTADITGYEEKDALASISGKVTAQGETQKCEVILTNVFRHEIAKCDTGNNGKYTFKNICDGLYFITAITQSEGMGFTVVVVRDGNVYGEVDISVFKPDKICNRENNFPQYQTKEDAKNSRAVIAEEKRWYDSLSEKEKKHCSKDYVDRLNQYCEWVSECENTGNGGTLENGEQLLSGDELESGESFEIILDITESEEAEINSDGIRSNDQYNQKQIEDAAGSKNIAKYYDIKLSKKDSKGEYEIKNISRDTNTTGKVRITMDIPEEYRGHKHYHFVHVHNGVATTLIDLDDNPDTVTFEVDKFSTFALTYTDNQLAIDGDIEEMIEKKEIVVGRTMVLGNSLAMNFYINAEEVEYTDRVIVEHIFADGRESEKVEKLISECEPSNIGGNMHMITINTIAAKEMSDTINVTIYDADGQQKSKDYSTTVRDYALALFDNPSTTEKLKAVAVNMLNYGTEAQKFFNYNVDDLANGWFTDEHLAYIWEEPDVTLETLVTGEKYRGMTLLLESNIALTGYFERGDTDVSDMYAVAEFTDHYGNQKTEVIHSKDFNMSYETYNYFGVDITEVVIADLKQPVKLIVYEKNGTVFDELTFSIENYIAKTGDAAEQSAVSKALAKFALASKSFFSE